MSFDITQRQIAAPGSLPPERQVPLNILFRQSMLWRLNRLAPRIQPFPLVRQIRGDDRVGFVRQRQPNILDRQRGFMRPIGLGQPTMVN